MKEIIYIDYAIRLLEAAKRKRKKKTLREGLIGSTIEKIKNVFKNIINKVKSLLARVIGRKAADEVSYKTDGRFKEIVKLSQNPNTVKIVEKELIVSLSQLKDKLETECNKPDCKDVVKKTNELISKIKEISRGHLIESAFWQAIKGGILNIKDHLFSIAIITGFFLVYDLIMYFYRKVIKGRKETENVEKYENETIRGKLLGLVKHVLRRIKKAAIIYIIVFSIFLILALILYLISPSRMEKVAQEVIDYLASKQQTK